MRKLFLGALLISGFLTGCGCVKDNSTSINKVSTHVSTITNTITSTISSTFNNSTSNTDKTSSIISSVMDDISSVLDNSTGS